jgi:dihydrofolate reductase
MGRVIYHAHLSLDGRVGKPDGSIWEPFNWGEEGMRHVSAVFRSADIWLLGRGMYTAIVPWWSAVAYGSAPSPEGGDISPATSEFADIFRQLRIAVFSRTMTADSGHTVIADDPVDRLSKMKAETDAGLVLSCGAELHAMFLRAGLIDEYLLAFHPIVVGAGRGIFEDTVTDLSLHRTQLKAFDDGSFVVQYQVRA